MSRFRVLQSYRSSTAGPFAEGDEVELNPAVAAWVESDAPGTLEPADVSKDTPEAEPEPEPEAESEPDDAGIRAPDEPPSDRMQHRESSPRRGPGRPRKNPEAN